MFRKLVWIGAVCILLVGCSGDNAPVEEPTLDGTRLNQTAVSLVTQDFAQTQTHVPTDTPTPTLTPTAIPTLDRTRPPVYTPTSELPCNMAAAGVPLDITIPDDTQLAPGTSFSKTWRLQNVGTCTWTRLYTLTFFSGNSLSAQFTQYLQQPVEPGALVDLTVDMIAPDRIGIYQSNWMLSDPDGALFGIGPHGDAPFWTRIEVVQVVTDTPQPTATLTPTPVVYMTGEVELVDGDELDLEKAILNPEDETQADLLYQYDATPIYILSPINDLKWSLYGNTEPGPLNCMTVTLSDDALEFDQVPVGMYFCFQTKAGMRGWFLIESFDNDKLAVRFLTWANP